MTVTADVPGGAAASPASNGAPVILFDGVTKVYGSQDGLVHAVDNVTAAIHEGEFVSLVGPSGCGKTTLLMMAAGITPANGGEVRVHGKTVDRPQTDLGIVFQDPTLLPWRTVLENVMLQIELRKLPKEPHLKRAVELLESTGLDGFESKYPHELSGGMKQRVSLVRALIHDPPLLLMDEPFGALDALTRDQMNIDMQNLRESGGQTTLFVTHSVSEAVFLSDRIFVMTPRPARVEREIVVDLPRPRKLDDRENPRFAELIGEIRDVFVSQGVLRQ